jgi:hypothetical protein
MSETRAKTRRLRWALIIPAASAAIVILVPVAVQLLYAGLLPNWLVDLLPSMDSSGKRAYAEAVLLIVALPAAGVALVGMGVALALLANLTSAIGADKDDSVGARDGMTRGQAVRFGFLTAASLGLGFAAFTVRNVARANRTLFDLLSTEELASLRALGDQALTELDVSSLRDGGLDGAHEDSASRIVPLINDQIAVDVTEGNFYRIEGWIIPKTVAHLAVVA